MMSSQVRTENAQFLLDTNLQLVILFVCWMFKRTLFDRPSDMKNTDFPKWMQSDDRGYSYHVCMYLEQDNRLKIKCAFSILYYLRINLMRSTKEENKIRSRENNPPTIQPKQINMAQPVCWDGFGGAFRGGDTALYRVFSFWRYTLCAVLVCVVNHRTTTVRWFINRLYCG